MAESNTDIKESSNRNPVLLVGLIVAAVVALLVFLFATALQGTGKVYVAKGSLPAYSVLQPGANIVLKDVPENSITDNDLTEADVKKSKGQLITRVEVLDGQRIDYRATTASTTGTLSVVKPATEVAMAVDTNFRGIIGGIVTPGSVVDIYSGNGSSEKAPLLAGNVKVIGVGNGAASTSNITTKTSSATSKDQDANILVIVAIPKDAASALAGANTVTMAINPYLTFNNRGTICTIGRCNNTAASAPKTTTTTDTTTSATTPSETATTQSTTTPTTLTTP